jgi:hypothetical protein
MFSTIFLLEHPPSTYSIGSRNSSNVGKKKIYNIKFRERQFTSVANWVDIMTLTRMVTAQNTADRGILPVRRMGDAK